jgi:hypothetical protein
VTVAPNNRFQSFAEATITVPTHGTATHAMNLKASEHWYDFTVSSTNFQRLFAGRMETGADGISDPAMASKMRFPEFRPHREFRDAEDGSFIHED